MHTYALHGMKSLYVSGFLQQLRVWKKIQALHLSFSLHLLV